DARRTKKNSPDLSGSRPRDSVDKVKARSRVTRARAPPRLQRRPSAWAYAKVWLQEELGDEEGQCRIGRALGRGEGHKPEVRAHFGGRRRIVVQNRKSPLQRSTGLARTIQPGAAGSPRRRLPAGPPGRAAVPDGALP